MILPDAMASLFGVRVLQAMTAGQVKRQAESTREMDDLLHNDRSGNVTITRLVTHVWYSMGRPERPTTTHHHPPPQAAPVSPTDLAFTLSRAPPAKWETHTQSAVFAGPVHGRCRRDMRKINECRNESSTPSPPENCSFAFPSPSHIPPPYQCGDDVTRAQYHLSGTHTHVSDHIAVPAIVAREMPGHE